MENEGRGRRERRWFLNGDRDLDRDLDLDLDGDLHVGLGNVLRTIKRRILVTC